MSCGVCEIQFIRFKNLLFFDDCSTVSFIKIKNAVFYLDSVKYYIKSISSRFHL